MLRSASVCGVICALAFAAGAADRAQAAILVSGDQIALTAIEESPNAGAAYPVQLTVVRIAERANSSTFHR